MLELIKRKIWDLLKEKDVSLVMIYDHKGDILWHKGRKIKGGNVHKGEGFSKTFIRKTLNHPEPFEREYVVIDSSLYGLPASASKLLVKNLIIQPLANGNPYFLYVDSGSKSAFSETDREIFKCLGEVLAEMLRLIRLKSGSETGGITGNSKMMEQVKEKLLKYSLEEKPVLLLGETGVGKSHVAELLHRYSGRKGKFVTLHTPGIPDNLFESELFGYKKGAFTGAGADKKGLVDEAAGGTLFFDEISEVPVSFQAKLLRFIENRKYLVLGESVERTADVRIAAATNRNLHQAIKNKEFREDLYYRLHILEIDIPPLRERKEDIKALVMGKKELLKGKQMGSGFWETLYDHDWPGNVRELLTVLTRAGIQCEHTVSGTDLRDIIHQGPHKNPVTGHGDKAARIREDIEAGKEFWDAAWQPFINREIDRDTIKGILKTAYEDAKHSFKRMIKILNMDKKDYHSFMSLMRKYKIDPRS
jgi:transcriptional regulator with PAS, ATPase and Fis domain